MRARDRYLWTVINRRANALSPDVAVEVDRAFRVIRESLEDEALADLIVTGQLDQLIDDALLNKAFTPLSQKLVEVTRSGFQATVSHELPRTAKGAVMFDVLNPRIIDAVRDLNTKVITDLKENVREVVRAHVENGLRDGKAPRSIAKDLTSVLHLTPAQTSTVARTATLDSMKLGQRLSWQDAISKGVVTENQLRRTWVTVGDDRVREEHQEMQGEEVRFNEPFSNGEITPGESTYGCRCIVRMTVLRDAA